MNLLVVPFIETTIPLNLEENEHGVAHHVLEAKGMHKGQKTHWSIEIMSVNGIWYGCYDVQTDTAGCCGPCMRTSPFADVEECITYYHGRICAFLKSNNKSVPLRPSFEDFKESYPYNYE